MAIRYLEKLKIPFEIEEINYLMQPIANTYNNYYPFNIFPYKDLQFVEFAPITIFYGGNGSGKSTLLNIISEKLGVIRNSPFNGSAFFQDYVDMCDVWTKDENYISGRRIPAQSRILTSDDVSEYLLNMRYVNDKMEVEREKIFEE